MPERRAFAPQYASVQHRDETAEIGMWVFLATEVLLFGGLLFAYFVYRHANPNAFAEAGRHTRIVIGSANTAILLTSSFFVACAVNALQADARRICIAMLASAMLLGLLFLGLKATEYAGEYHEHLVPDIDFSYAAPLADGVELFFIFYFVATSIHAVHMVIGIAVLATLAVLLRRSASTRLRAALHSAALYWHFVDVVWIVLFALIYLPGRSGT
ncbi:cytochrome c oxidase subunit 3 [Bradyrhizobium brasilense]|uniref:cytochrome c oxidase subunit 3 n=1 Tax=Bradyrhizobium brasilense TaxID=1419277 RepID=UPI0024B27D60|nr:cytochrome c oxidase subunit 3 [Bradyrhizobium australafricanum]WFU34518.1 cytochrome c oxidase subunit 3 [Bradyrhizobium australafricanum]